MTGVQKAGDAAWGQLHTEQVVQQLARTSIRDHLAFHQGDDQRLDAGSLLDRGFERCREASSRQMKTGWALLFFDAMLSYPEALGG